MLHTLQEPAQELVIIDRLGHDVFGTVLDFPFQAVHFAFRVLGRRVRAYSDNESGLAFHGAPAHIQPLVQVSQQRYQADGVHVEDTGGRWVIAHQGRIAGYRQDVAKPVSVGPQHIGLEPEKIPVPAGSVKDGLNPHFPLEDKPYGLGVDPGGSPRAVGDVDHVHAGRSQGPGPFHYLVQSQPPGGIDLHTDNKLALDKFATQG
ncbi:hypothetical protein ES703_109711 [subsurface metagenome]